MSDAIDDDAGYPYDDGVVIPEVEIVGLRSNSNGRSCCQHTCCGKRVQVGDVLRLKLTYVTINRKTEEAIKLVKIADGTDTCTVAFMKKDLIRKPSVRSKLDKFVMVTELYKDSETPEKLALDKTNRGVAGCVFLDNIPISE
jgi:hypothetical protein